MPEHATPNAGGRDAGHDADRPPAEMRTDVRVRYGETDQMGIVYHAHYLVWCDIGRTEFIRSLGTAYSVIEQGGVVLAVADASLRFHAPARCDDRIAVLTRVAAVRSRAIVFRYVIANADTGHRLCSAETTMISLDRDGRPRALPRDLRDRLAATCVGE
jgi:acyl-CoA thioester hydrolase